MRLKKKILLIAFVCVASVIFAAGGIFAYAYFSKKEIYDGYFSGQVELLFDRLSDKGIENYKNDLAAGGETVDVNKKAKWGSKEYPYVISNVRHLYNLSELQRLGYFDKKFIKQNPTGSYSDIPYFLVCTPDYKPATIDGTNFKSISPIGTDEYPFIGSVKGVKYTPKETDTTDDRVYADVNNKSCDTSAICNVKVAGDPNNVDVGLFGTIGFLGTEPTDGTTTTFTGQISTVSNLVLSDVQITVDSSLWKEIAAFVEDIMKAASGHNYSFSELHGTTDYDKVPHENHHIGILTGHAAYTNIEFISVYYSSDSVVAIDLKDATDVSGTKANYLSSTGILGFIDNLNPTVSEDENGKQTITAGSGDSVSDLSYSPVGGGGAASGEKAGYVLAGEMYEKFHYIKDASGTINGDNDGTIFIKDALDEDGTPLCTEWVRDRLLWGTEATGRYYFYDGVFTFALSAQSDVIEPTWGIKTDENGDPVWDDTGKPIYNDAPQFSIGQDNDSAWNTNTAKGNKAAVAYVKKVHDDTELQNAIKAGKQIFIMKEGTESLFLMSLYNQSTAGNGTFEEKYTTPGTTKEFGSQEFINGLVDAYESGALKLPTGDKNDMTADYNTEAKVAEALRKGEIKPIRVGTTSKEVTLEVLKQQYKITPKVIAGNYSYFAGDTPVAVNSNGTIQQYYDYANSDYGKAGYIYYTEIREDTTTTNYEYYWQSSDGSSTLIGTGVDGFGSWNDSNLPEDVFTDTGNTWEGEKIYSCSFGGKPYTGVVVNKSTGTFYGSGNTANANSATLTKPTEGDAPIYYFYNDIRTDTESDKVYKFSSDGNGTEYYYSQFTDTGNTSPSGKPIYEVDGKQGVLLDRYPTYTFSNGDNYLRMVEAKFSTRIIVNISFGTHYALWNGSDNEASTATNFNHNYLGTITPTVTNSTAATLRFNADGTCYIQYSIGSTGLYVNSTGTAFNTATSNSSTGAKLCIYTVEGTQDISYGRISFDPIDDTASETDSYSFSAGEYVLVANPTHTRQNGNTGNITATSTGYTVTSLEELKWNNGAGTTLSQADLKSKFKMTKGITFGASFNLLNGTIGSSGIITAPVGTEGVEANIPQGCIAFRINKPVESAKIRIIVSVAVSELYPGEEGYNLGDYTRYFNLWKMEEAGESIVQIFNATGNNLLDRIEIPRSHPYEPGTAPKDAEYITVRYNGIDYRCYLNGDRVLIAYEFTVNTTTAGTGTGVYCLGMSGINQNGDVVGDVPMEIIYFSADGVASSGRDGENNSQIGTIDFVYDYGEKIVTVTEKSFTNDAGNEDYSTYYPSYCLLYFDTTQHVDPTNADSAFMPVNNEKVIIRRFVDTVAQSDSGHNTTKSLSTLLYKFTTLNDANSQMVKIVQYAAFADNVRQQGTTTDTPATG